MAVLESELSAALAYYRDHLIDWCESEYRYHFNNYTEVNLRIIAFFLW